MPVRTGKGSFIPNKARRELVERLVHDGLTIGGIAAVLGCTRDTVYAHFPDELENGRARVQAKLTALLWKEAKAGNVTAMKHLDSRNNPSALKPEQVGKKEAQVQESHTAHEGTGWDSAVKSLNS